MTGDLYVDVVEKVTAIFGASGNIVNSYIDGTVVCKSYVEGSPIFKLLFCETLSVGDNQNYGIKMDNVNFNSCVDYSQFEINKSLTFTPPAGTCDLMYYKVSKDFNYPFKVTTFLSEVSNYKISLDVKVNSVFSKDVKAKFVNLSISVPELTGKVRLELPEGTKN